MWAKSIKGIGIVVCNFKKGEIPHAIDLSIGDQVVIEQQCQGWYKGYLVNNKSVSGIFPSQYVHIQQPGQRVRSAYDEGDSVVEELNDTLKEWFKALKKGFVTNSPQQDMLNKSIQVEIQKLLKLRTEYTAPYLTARLKTELRSKITNKLDWGNKKLGLDLVPRVDGVQVNTDTFSPVDLYLIHDSSISSGNKTIKPTRAAGSKQYNSHHMHMQVKCLANIDNEDTLELYYSLYDAEAMKFISERVMCRLGRGGIIQSTENTECGEFFTAMFVDLTTSDLNLDLYLTAHIYKLSGLRSNEKSKSRTFGSSKNVVNYKRPYGCAAVSVRDVLTQNKTSDEDESPIGKEFGMPMMTVKNKDEEFFSVTDLVIRKIRDRKTDEMEKLNVVLGMFHGDILSVKQEYPQIFNKRVKITQKLGFADVVAPEYSAHYVLLANDVRNDFYLNLYECDFEKGGKTADKNIEAKVFVVDQDGEEKACISGMAGEPPSSMYEAAVFYHTNKPKWREVIKISLPEHVFRDCHIRIEFRHCSTQGAEKKFFGFSYLPLEDRKGTTIQDRRHSLVVYKPDKKEGTDLKKNCRPHYLNLSYESGNPASPTATSNQYCSMNPKDSCYVQTTLCSTKLTQDVNLLNILKWNYAASPEQLLSFLDDVVKIDDNELMKHHVDFLNSLFQMSCDAEAGRNQNPIFRALVHILSFTKKRNFRQFLPMFEMYIEKTFCATLAHRDLLNQIKLVLEQQKDKPNPLLPQVIEVLDLLFKFIVRSAVLFAGEKADDDHHILSKGMDEFWRALQDVIKHTKHQSSSAQAKISKMSIISRVVDVFPDLIKLLPADKLAKSFSETISLISKRDSDVGEHKLKCLSKLINSPLFEHPDSRRIVLDLCNAQLHHCLHSHQDLKLAAQNLADLLSAIYKHKGTMKEEIELVVLKLTRDVCDTIISVDMRDVVRLLMACLITMLSMMEGPLVNKLVNQQQQKGEEKIFLKNMLKILTDIISQPDIYIPSDWIVMLLVTNSVTLTAAQNFSQAVASDFTEDTCFDEGLWGDFFMLCVHFITQPCLQLEEFSDRKETRIREKYEDMRIEMANHIYEMWNTLGEFGENQVVFIPSMIGPFLQVALLPEKELRTTLLQVLNDMLMYKFNEVEGEIIDKLDELYSKGKGDLSFKNAFVQLMSEKVSSDSSGRSSCMTHYIDSVSTLIDKLLDYRTVLGGRTDNPNTLMLSTVNLLDFYRNGIKRERLYSHYVYKLRDLNLSMGRFTEAGFALLLNASNLSWTDQHQLADDNCDAEKEWERKERLYEEVITYLDKGQSWEDAIPLCKELAVLYETKLFDYVKLTNILKRQADLFSKVIPGAGGGQPRLAAKYYRVAFYGQTLPFSIRNKAFVYKGDAFTGPSTVKDMLKAEYPNAEQLNESIEPAKISLLNPNKQYFQLVIIEPIVDMDGLFPQSLRAVDYKISSFYQWNRVERFIYDKPYHHPHKDKENEHKTLHTKRYLMKTVRPMPGISTWSELVDMTSHTIRPVEVALEALRKKNFGLKNIIQKYRDDRGLDQKELTMVLKGSAAANVNGGIIMYQKAFLADDTVPEVHSSALRQLILEHLRILRDGLYLLKEIVTSQLKPLTVQLFEEFHKLQHMIKDQDPSIELVSLKSIGSGSLMSVPDYLSSESNRASSDYSGSDVESHKDVPLLSRRSVSMSGSTTHLPSRVMLSAPEERSDSPVRRQDGQLRETDKGGRSRGNSTFYTETPSYEEPKAVDTSSEDECDGENDNSTLERDEPPPLPTKCKKRRSSSLPFIGNVDTLSICSQTPDSSLQPTTFDPANRPLPETPNLNIPKPSIPRRSKTVNSGKCKGLPPTEYTLPRDTKAAAVPPQLPQRHHPSSHGDTVQVSPPDNSNASPRLTKERLITPPAKPPPLKPKKPKPLPELSETSGGSIPTSPVQSVVSPRHGTDPTPLPSPRGPPPRPNKLSTSADSAPPVPDHSSHASSLIPENVSNTSTSHGTPPPLPSISHRAPRPLPMKSPSLKNVFRINNNDL